MTTYLILKSLHILSAFLLFGTGLGSAFYKYMADRRGNIEAIAITNRHVVLADWLFTTPSVIFQPISGILLANLLKIPLSTPWLATAIALYILAGLCWLPVVVLQIRMRTLSEQAVHEQANLPSRYYQYARFWFWLGVPAFLAMFAVVFLMVFRSVFWS